VYVPTKVFFTKGVGKHKDYLQSFELALRNAGIEICNIVTVSSIFPAGCKRISREEGLKLIQPGQIAFVTFPNTTPSARQMRKPVTTLKTLLPRCSLRHLAWSSIRELVGMNESNCTR
jgi:arginine decarboxylase